MYSHVPVTDVSEADISLYFDGAAYFMETILTSSSDQGGGSIVVHCEQGVSRSSSIVIAYLMRYHNMSRDEAYLKCKRRRPIIYPNPGFWDQLKKYETRLNTERNKHDDTNLLEQKITPSSEKHNNWALRSCYIYSTCAELPIHNLLQNMELIGPLYDAIKNNNNLSHFIFVSLDFLWGRGLLGIDLDWFVFLYRHMSDRIDDDARESDVYIVRDLVKEQLNEGVCQLIEFWGGEIYPNEVRKFLVAISNCRRQQF